MKETSDGYTEKDLQKFSKVYLWEQLKTVENERENIINLLNEALDIVCPNDCQNCLWKSYCQNTKG